MILNLKTIKKFGNIGTYGNIGHFRHMGTGIILAKNVDFA
jgi:hypothetical protein